MVSEAFAQREAEPCFWLRGIIPASAASVPPPPSEEDWRVAGCSGVLSGSRGVWSLDSPLIVFSDCSGGKDTHDPQLRRCGLALAAISEFEPISVTASISGPLPGKRQTVARGERYAFELALHASERLLCYFTGNDAVITGFLLLSFRIPVGA